MHIFGLLFHLRRLISPGHLCFKSRTGSVLLLFFYSFMNSVHIISQVPNLDRLGNFWIKLCSLKTLESYICWILIINYGILCL